MKEKHPKAVAAIAAVRTKQKPQAEQADDGQVIRPLVLWLRKRPKTVSARDRHDEWKRMSPEAKTEFSLATKAERNAR